MKKNPYQEAVDKAGVIRSEGLEVFFDRAIKQVVKSHKAHATDREDNQEVFLLVVPR